MDPALDAGGEREESAKVSSGRETTKDESHDDKMVTLDGSSQLPPRRSIIDVSVAGISRSSLDAENTGEYPSRQQTYTSLPVDGTFPDALPLDNQISVPVFTQIIDRMTTEARRVPTTSLSPVTAFSTYRIADRSSRTTHLPTSELLTSGPLLQSSASAPPPDDVAIGHTELCRTPSDDLNVRSSPSPPVLDAILPTGLLLFPGRSSI